jgi:hypothetical protein
LKIKIFLSTLFIFVFSNLAMFSQAMNGSHSHHEHKVNKTKHYDHKSKNNQLKVTLTPKINSYPKLKPIKFVLNVFNGNDPVDKANISMDLTMPDMSMPKNEIKFTQVRKGIYESEGMFTMSGDWTLVTSINFNNKKEIRNFNIIVD